MDTPQVAAFQRMADAADAVTASASRMFAEAHAREAQRRADHELADLMFGEHLPDNGTATSREAALSMLPHVETQRRAIYDRLRECVGPQTREDLERALDMAGNSLRPRVAELIAAGLIEEVPNAWGTTLSGRRATLLRVIHDQQEAA